MPMTNTHSANYISQIQLPGSTTKYQIHDEEAIHSLADLGLSTPLNFKGTVEYYSDLTDDWTSVFTSTIESLAMAGDDQNITFNTPFDFGIVARLPWRVCYIEHYNADDHVKLEHVETNTIPITSWASDIFQSNFVNYTQQQSSVLGWTSTTNKFSLYANAALETIETWAGSKDINTTASIEVFIHGAIRGAKNGDVYLVRSTGQEYVYLIEDGATEGRWEPLGSVHDAASSTHTHSINTSATGTFSYTKLNSVQSSTIYIDREGRQACGAITKAGVNGVAPELDLKVTNGTLTIGWKAGTAATMPVFGQAVYVPTIDAEDSTGADITTTEFQMPVVNAVNYTSNASAEVTVAVTANTSKPIG